MRQPVNEVPRGGSSSLQMKQVLCGDGFRSCQLFLDCLRRSFTGRLAAVCLGSALWISNPGTAAGQGTTPATAPSGAVRVFLDCNSCDETFLKTEITYIDYVRDRTDADLHV